ncbi:MAG: trypsin-like peptidase domain-containing protein [Spirochaetia bacterium]|nr:trypsin-like peptidase domain-containing protein [Spirochaetia bacterium]
MLKDVRISRLTFINLILAALLIGTFLSPIVYGGLRHYFVSYENGNAESLKESDQKPAIALQTAYTNVYKKVSPSVVFIKTNVLIPPRYWFDYYRQGEGAGSGFIIDKEGFILTNAHVVANANKIEVIFHDSTQARAKLIGRDDLSDIALIQVAPSDKLVPCVFGDSDKVEPGQLAFAIGAPFGLDRTFTVGVISAKHRQIDASRFSRIQTDASINPGNSGGPLINVMGEVVGINQSIISPNGQGGSVGIGFAIPINEVKSVIEQLKREKRVIGRPALGLQVGVPAESLREELKLGRETGLLVIMVVPGSAADEAGLKESDFLLSANGHALKLPQELVQEVQKTGIGGKLKLDLIRQGRRTSITATIGEDSTSR